MLRPLLILLIAALSCASLPLRADDTQDTRTRIFSPQFATLKVMKDGDFMSQPIIALNSGEQIVVTFDELTDSRSYLQYSITHCNADWQPSALLPSEYVSGFNCANVTDMEFSVATFMHYVNYRIAIPSDDMQPLVSGNYLLTVYPENEPESPLLQARFSVSEDAVEVTGYADIHTDRGSYGDTQQLRLQVATGSMRLLDSFSDIFLVVEQNSRPDTRVTIRHPQRVETGKLIYDHEPQLIFPSGNEFRRFETVRADYPGMHTDSVRYTGPIYSAYLAVDAPRAEAPYLYDKTQFGRFKIDEYNSSDPDLGADYIFTRFTLDFPRVMNADIYLDGEFTHHLYSPQYRMAYDPASYTYSLTLPLKQGSYNYQYVAVPHSDSIPAEQLRGVASLVEGDKAETTNEYTIYAFMRQPSWRADRLMGVTTIYTIP